MKQFLIINQAISNHGDEAAHKGLVRNLSDANTGDVAVLFCLPSLPDLEQRNFRPKDLSGLTHHHVTPKLYHGRFCKLTMVLPDPLFRWAAQLHPSLRQMAKRLGQATHVISAPGGLDIGLYRNWINLWNIRMSQALGKHVALYSPSIGPWPSDGFWDRLFTRRARSILGKLDFLSLRDERSQQLASQEPWRYLDSVDTAFADRSAKSTLPSTLDDLIPSSSFAVVVPNQLCRWHREFRQYDEQTFEEFYHKLIDRVLDTGREVVLLPQLFGLQNDQHYFTNLAKAYDERVHIIPDELDSDTQQAIVQKADFLIGCRYHSIIFALRNRTPFLSLAYEHKMTNTLSLLGLQDFNEELHEVLADEAKLLGPQIARLAGDQSETRQRLKRAADKAENIALQTFQAYLNSTEN